MQREKNTMSLLTGLQQKRGALGDLVNWHGMMCISLQITKRKGRL